MEEVVNGQEDNNNSKVDYALLRPPIDIGKNGAVQVYKCLQNGTDELSNLLQYECDIIFECKVCRSLFRGLANFISHKRVYCTKYYQDSLIEFVKPGVEDDTVVVEPEAPEAELAQSDKQNTEGQSSSCSSKSVLDSILDGSYQGTSAAYSFYTKAGEEDGKKKAEKKTTVLQIKPIQGNGNAVFQSVQNSTNTGKSGNGGGVVSNAQQQVTKPSNSKVSTVKEGSDSDPVSTTSKPKNSALLEALCRDTVLEKPSLKPPEIKKKESTEEKSGKREKVLPASCTPTKNKHQKSKWGNNPVPIAVKLAQMKDCNPKTLTCLKCNTQYSSHKTLYFHLVSIHSEKRRFYPCIYCGTTFVQMWGVVRHVIRTHKKSRDQVEKLRDILRKKSFTKKVTTSDLSQKSKLSLPVIDSKSVNSTAEGGMVKTQSQEKIPTSVSPASSSSASRSSSRSPRLLPADDNKTAIRFPRRFPLHKCTRCGKAFARKDTLDRHLRVCNHKSGRKAEDDKSSAVSTISTRPKRTISARRSLYEANSDEETGKTSSAKKSKMVENNRGKAAKKSSTTSPVASVKWEASKQESAKSGPGYIDWKKVDQFIDKDNLVCRKCNSQYSNLHNVRRHVCIHLGWNRYKCKMCNFRAFHPSECRRHLSHSHPAAYKRNSDFSKLVLDLHKNEGPSKNQSDVIKTNKSKKNSKSKSKPVKKTTKSLKKASVRAHKKDAKSENPYARIAKKIAVKTSTAYNVNKMTALFTRSGYYLKTDDAKGGKAKSSPSKVSAGDGEETLKSRLSIAESPVSSSNLRQSPRGGDLMSKSTSPDESPISRVKESAKCNSRARSKSPICSNPSSSMPSPQKSNKTESKSIKTVNKSESSSAASPGKGNPVASQNKSGQVVSQIKSLLQSESNPVMAQSKGSLLVDQDKSRLLVSQSVDLQHVEEERKEQKCEDADNVKTV